MKFNQKASIFWQNGDTLLMKFSNKMIQQRISAEPDFFYCQNLFVKQSLDCALLSKQVKNVFGFPV